MTKPPKWTTRQGVKHVTVHPNTSGRVYLNEGVREDAPQTEIDVMMEAAALLKERCFKASFEHPPGFILLQCEGPRGNANFGVVNGDYDGSFDGGEAVPDFTLTRRATGTELADAIQAWAASHPEAKVTRVKCGWWLHCINDATARRSHPILGSVPICDRCAAKVERLSKK